MTDRDPDENGPELDALRQALRSEYRGRVDVPAEVDEAMRARSHLPFARIRRRRLLWIAVPAAAAAALALVVYLGPGSSDRGAGDDDAATVALARPDDAAGATEATPPAEPDVHPGTDGPRATLDAAATSTETAAPAEDVTAATDAAPPGPGALPHRRRSDVNGDGRVNILDAFVLAKSLEAGGDRDGEWDLSGDGRVDRTDVELLARTAVSVTGGGK